MDELFVEIQNAAKMIATPNCAAWMSAIASLSAVVVAIIIAVKQNEIAKKQNEIAKKQAEIAEQQNKIALFDKRYEVYRLVIKILNAGYELDNPDCGDEFYEILYRMFEQWQWPDKEKFFSDNFTPPALIKIVNKLSESKFLFPTDVYKQIDDLKLSFMSMVTALHLSGGHDKRSPKKILFLTSVKFFKSTRVLERMELDMQLQSIKLRE